MQLSRGLALFLFLGVGACAQTHAIDDPNLNPLAPTVPDASVDAAPDSPMASCQSQLLVVKTKGPSSNLRIGWSGIAHGIPLPDGAEFAAELFNCDADCTTCNLRGPIAVPDSKVVTRRCTADPTKIDTSASAIKCEGDDDCNGHGPCRYYFNSGLETNIGGATSCTRIIFTPLKSPVSNGGTQDSSPLQGFMNLVTGSVTFTHMNLTIEQGLGCNTCDEPDGDERNDVRNGKCAIPATGARRPCDVHDITASDPPKKVSFDCAWPAGGALLKFDVGPLRTGSVEWQLDGDDGPEDEAFSPECGAGTNKYCFCGLCANNPTNFEDDTLCRLDSDCNPGECKPIKGLCLNGKACTTAADCPTGACPGGKTCTDGFACANNTICTSRNAGTCIDRSVTVTKPNACTVTADNPSGQCILADKNTEPDRWKRGLGRCGTHPTDTSCFADNGVSGAKIGAFGDHGEFDENGKTTASLASIACFPPTLGDFMGIVAFDPIIGFPGPGAFELSVELRLEDIEEP